MWYNINMKNKILVSISIILIAGGLILVWYAYDSSASLKQELSSMDQKISDLSQKIELIEKDIIVTDENIAEVNSSVMKIDEDLNKLKSYGPSADLFK
jgi:peptidoglycan hydrolase CwlO-like protein